MLAISTNLYHNKINTSLLIEVETIDDFRKIRRVSLEEKFFEDFNMDIGKSFKYETVSMVEGEE